MSDHNEVADFIWIDERDPSKLDRSKQYKIEIGREYWNLRYAGLNEWICSREDGDDVVANTLIQAGCPVYVRREPLRWEGQGIVVLSQGELLIEGLNESIPPALLNRPIKIVLLEDVSVPIPLTSDEPLSSLG
ncbi:MAG TPA: hypothetical protein VK934_04210 [Fimbriimonas sp.]|nr:hypothetical protein [Fimbriimonas sp.]